MTWAMVFGPNQVPTCRLPSGDWPIRVIWKNGKLNVYNN